MQFPSVLRADIEIEVLPMYGRMCLRLLALVLIIPAGLCVAQSDHAESAREFVLPVSPRMPLPVPRTYFPNPAATYGLAQMSRAAGIIFSGTVTGIKRSESNLCRPEADDLPARGGPVLKERIERKRIVCSGRALETVTITFRVENAIRGTTPGDQLTIHQWSGLWTSGQRYRVGERLLLFLYSPSKIGLTSCVGGILGRFALDPRNRVLITPQQMFAFQRDPVLGGKSPVRLSDFALAVRQASEEE
jgi:hypothetical protein